MTGLLWPEKISKTQFELIHYQMISGLIHYHPPVFPIGKMTLLKAELALHSGWMQPLGGRTPYADIGASESYQPYKNRGS